MFNLEQKTESNNSINFYKKKKKISTLLKNLHKDLNKTAKTHKLLTKYTKNPPKHSTKKKKYSAHEIPKKKKFQCKNFPHQQIYYSNYYKTFITLSSNALTLTTHLHKLSINNYIKKYKNNNTS